MKLLAISGSLKSTSSNTAIVKNLKRLAPANWQIIIYDELGSLPHFNPEIDTEQAPEAVKTLREMIREADAVFICTPEYAYSVPGSLKNMLDWTVSSGEFVDKPVAAVSASPMYTGGDKALTSLILTLEVISAKVPATARLSIGTVSTKINTEGIITDEETNEKLKQALNSLTSLTSQNVVK
jgi:chromate reductase, NAD(P)H dehydrogenase (quinone)